MRTTVIVTAIRRCLSVVVVSAAIWALKDLWGPADWIAMKVSAGQGSDAPLSGISHTKYGRFPYMIVSASTFIDRTLVSSGQATPTSRVESNRAFYWPGVLETLAVSVGVVGITVAVLLGLNRATQRI